MLFLFTLQRESKSNLYRKINEASGRVDSTSHTCGCQTLGPRTWRIRGEGPTAPTRSEASRDEALRLPYGPRNKLNS